MSVEDMAREEAVEKKSARRKDASSSRKRSSVNVDMSDSMSEGESSQEDEDELQAVPHKRSKVKVWDVCVLVSFSYVFLAQFLFLGTSDVPTSLLPP